MIKIQRRDAKCCVSIIQKAQSTVEFTFVLVLIFLLAYGLVKVFLWSGLDLAERRFAHEWVLTQGTDANKQLVPDFYRARRMDSVHRGWNQP